MFKKALPILTAMLIAVTPALSEADNVITVTISEETAQYRDEKIFSTSDDSRNRTEEEQQARADAAIEALKASSPEQIFPESETVNALDHYDFEGSDVYTLTPSEDYDRVILYIHGGAWVYTVESPHVSLCDKLATDLNAKIYMPLYPLAPHADAAEDYAFLTDLYNELLKEGKTLYVMGDSAGATLTLGLVLQLKDAGITLPEKVVVMAPCADTTFTNPEIQEIQKVDGMLPWVFCRECAKLWAGDTDLSTPCVCPINGDYTGFPDTLMYVGTYDILCPDDIKLFEKMCDAGVNAQLVKGEGFWHVYLVSEVQEQPQLLEILKNFCED